MQQHRDLALDVDASEIVMVELRCHHALADKYQRRGEREFGLVVVHPGQKLGFERQRFDEAIADQLEARTIGERSEEHTSELQSLMRNSYAVFCLKKKKQIATHRLEQHTNNIVNH